MNTVVFKDSRRSLSYSSRADSRRSLSYSSRANVQSSPHLSIGDWPALRPRRREQADDRSRWCWHPPVCGEFATGSTLGERPIMRAAAEGDGWGVSMLLAAGANPEPGGEASPLELAVQIGHEEVAAKLLEFGAVVHRPAEEWGLGEGKVWPNAIQMAAQFGNLECLKLVVERDPKSIGRRDENWNSPVDLAAMFGHADCLEFLIEKGAKFNVKDREGRTPWEKCAASGADMGCLRVLEKHGARFNFQEGLFVQMIVLCGSAEAVRWTLEHGVSFNTIEEGGPVQVAVENGRVDALKIMLETVDPNAKNEAGCPLLGSAAAKGQVEVAKLLLNRLHTAASTQHAIDVNQTCAEGETPAYKAAEHGKLPCLKLLVEMKADLTIPTTEGGLPIHGAAFNGHIECLQYLVQECECNIDERMQDDEGKALTPLMLAAIGQPQICRWLTERGAEVNAKDNEGATALHIAAEHGKPECVTALVEAGADVNMPRGEDGRSAALLALGRTNATRDVSLKVYDYLAANTTIDFSLKPTAGPDFLMLAIKVKRLELVKHLLDVVKVDPNQGRDEDGRGALWYSLSHLREAFDMLVAAGADVKTTTNAGENLLQRMKRIVKVCGENDEDATLIARLEALGLEPSESQ